jgi:hypothetical protein
MKIFDLNFCYGFCSFHVLFGRIQEAKFDQVEIFIFKFLRIWDCNSFGFVFLQIGCKFDCSYSDFYFIWVALGSKYDP